MTVQELQDQIKQLDDAEFQELLSWVVTPERERRAAQPAIDKAQADIVTELQESGKLEKPEVATEEQAKANVDAVPEWQDPGTDHSRMYHQGDVVRHQGKLVRSTHAGLNSWEPGALAFDGRIWEILETTDEPETSETTEQPAAPAFKQPTGAHDVYKQGDKVTFNGEVYESLINTNAYSPEAYPQGWKKL
ncbi:hypothetical protein HMPREF3169_09645 [Corynebacterium sp. HMSC08C04]|uniref:hypothetical protein n=1 Tax=Corynebacterium sp. HMSC08C04 TaxID=1581137 RepID=UPI0008A28AED|nr:hypothetical protein [Corynebacterium sp. HMSC08C04]OFT32787.1 hypothetical protein HMPREF3169_09645 [Corynebacterium sp. HMSC08C04]